MLGKDGGGTKCEPKVSIPDRIVVGQPCHAPTSQRHGRSMITKEITGIITARGGSKWLPGKCLLPLAGKPLIAHTIEAALGCPQIRQTVVTTEDPRIAAFSR